MKTAKQLQSARMSLVEKALVQAVEEIDGKVPSEETILKEGLHVALQPGPLSTFRRDGKEWTTFYVWRRVNAIAIAFDLAEPLVLHSLRLTPDEWPVALKLLCAKKFAH